MRGNRENNCTLAPEADWKSGFLHYSHFRFHSLLGQRGRILDEDPFWSGGRSGRYSGPPAAKKSLLSKYLSDLGRKGGKAGLTTMTAEQTREIAIKASKAAAKARTRKAKERKAQNG
jgi:hypothetical protein